jgi:hypothetical protein
MTKFNYFITFFFLFLIGCTGTTIQQYNSEMNKSPNSYHSLSCPSYDPTGIRSSCGVSKSTSSQLEANKYAVAACRKSNTNCVVVAENGDWVFSNDEKIKFPKNFEMNRSNNSKTDQKLLEDSLKSKKQPENPQKTLTCIKNKVGGIESVNCY